MRASFRSCEGAFTGAIGTVRADRAAGTLLLDEVGEIPFTFKASSCASSRRGGGGRTLS
jgi:DNA-binding NtrC family response regulator